MRVRTRHFAKSADVVSNAHARAYRVVSRIPTASPPVVFFRRLLGSLIDDTEPSRMEHRLQAMCVSAMAIRLGFWLQEFYWPLVLITILPLFMCELERQIQIGRHDKVHYCHCVRGKHRESERARESVRQSRLTARVPCRKTHHQYFSCVCAYVSRHRLPYPGCVARAFGLPIPCYSICCGIPRVPVSLDSGFVCLLSPKRSCRGCCWASASR